MKSSTLHRSNLTKERMSMLENVKFQALNSADLNQYIRVNRNPELDVLYRSVNKNRLSSKNNSSKTSVYIGIGLIALVFFVFLVGIIVGLSVLSTNNGSAGTDVKNKAKVEILTSDAGESTQNGITEEKYTIKSGDTLDKIAFRFYGKYDLKKIEEIKRINNIINPEALQIGQVIIVPLNK